MPSIKKDYSKDYVRFENEINSIMKKFYLKMDKIQKDLEKAKIKKIRTNLK